MVLPLFSIHAKKKKINNTEGVKNDILGHSVVTTAETIKTKSNLPVGRDNTGWVCGC